MRSHASPGPEGATTRPPARARSKALSKEPRKKGTPSRETAEESIEKEGETKAENWKLKTESWKLKAESWKLKTEPRRLAAAETDHRQDDP